MVVSCSSVSPIGIMLLLHFLDRSFGCKALGVINKPKRCFSLFGSAVQALVQLTILLVKLFENLKGLLKRGQKSCRAKRYVGTVSECDLTILKEQKG